MLHKIRSSSNDIKSKLALYLAIIITVVIVIIWFLNSSGRLYKTYSKVSELSVAFFGFLNKNVERAYSEFKNEASIEKIKQNIEQIKQSGLIEEQKEVQEKID